MDSGVETIGGQHNWGKPSKGVGFVSDLGRLAPVVVAALHQPTFKGVLRQAANNHKKGRFRGGLSRVLSSGV